MCRYLLTTLPYISAFAFMIIFGLIERTALGDIASGFKQELLLPHGWMLFLLGTVALMADARLEPSIGKVWNKVTPINWQTVWEHEACRILSYVIALPITFLLLRIVNAAHIVDFLAKLLISGFLTFLVIWPVHAQLFTRYKKRHVKSEQEETDDNWQLLWPSNWRQWSSFVAGGFSFTAITYTFIAGLLMVRGADVYGYLSSRSFFICMSMCLVCTVFFGPVMFQFGQSIHRYLSLERLSKKVQDFISYGFGVNLCFSVVGLLIMTITVLFDDHRHVPTLFLALCLVLIVSWFAAFCFALIRSGDEYGIEPALQECE